MGERNAVWAKVKDKFDNTQPDGTIAYGATLRQNRIFLPDRAFYQGGNIIAQMLWAVDLPGIITHELFHVAGLNEDQAKALAADIQKNCGTPGDLGVAR